VSPEIVISETKEAEEPPIVKPDEDRDDEVDDEVVLSEPQVINMSPMSTDEITNTRITIKATLVAGEDATIDEESIMFKLDNIDYSDQIKINKISDSQYTIIYQPQQDLEAGLHKAEAIFKDSKGSDVSKSWSFTIQALGTEDSSTYNIFGYEIGKNVVRIIAIGIVTVILAIVAPFIIFSIWKGDETKDDSSTYSNPKLPPSIPTDTTEYILVEGDSGIKHMVQTEPKQEESSEEDVWDKYSAPKPQPQEEDLSVEEKGPKVEPIEETQPIKQEVEVKVEQTPPPQEEDLSVEEKDPKVEQTPPPIPEPEIPEVSELQKLSEQLQKIREQEKKEGNNNQPTKV
jgi:hypothetical protein